MSTCKKFTDLISGKEYDYSDEKIAQLKEKHNKDNLKRVMFFKKYCVLGQIKHYNDFLIEKGYKKAPVKAAKGKAAKKKVVKKKVNLPKCVTAGCDGGKVCNAKTGRCVKNQPKGAKKIKVAGEDFFVTSSSQKKKIEGAKGKKASPPKKVAVSPKKSASKKKSSGKKSSGKKSPPKKVNLPKCVEAGCKGGKICNVKSGRCVKNQPKGAKKIEVAGQNFFVTTSSQQKKVEGAKGKKASPPKKVSVSPKKSASKKKSSSKRSPPKKVAVSSKKPSSKKPSPKKSPPKKVVVPKCLESGCKGGKVCNVKTGNCVKNKPKGADKYEFAGKEFFVTTSSQKKKVRDVIDVSVKKRSTPKTPSMRSSVALSTPGSLVKSLQKVSERASSDRRSGVELSELSEGIRTWV